MGKRKNIPTQSYEGNEVFILKEKKDVHGRMRTFEEYLQLLQEKVAEADKRLEAARRNVQRQKYRKERFERDLHNAETNKMRADKLLEEARASLAAADERRRN